MATPEEWLTSAMGAKRPDASAPEWQHAITHCLSFATGAAAPSEVDADPAAAAFVEGLAIRRSVVACGEPPIPADGDDEHAWLRDWGRYARCYLALARGEAVEVPSPESRNAFITLDHACLSAWAALGAKPGTEGLQLARRAVRMARTEAMPFYECLAAILLARARRVSGQGFLAAHIARAAADIVPALFGPWLRHERLLAADPAFVPELTPLDSPRLAAVRGALARRTDLARDLVPLSRLLGEGDSATHFSEGRRGTVPLGLEPLCRETSSGVATYVLWSSGGVRRYLGGADAVAHVHRVGEEVQRRVLEGFAVLAEAKGTLPLLGFFAAVYGFAYEPTRHASTLKALLHRMRAAVGERAVLARESGVISLHVNSVFAVADPPQTHPMDDQILGELAAGITAAREIAARLGISLRKVQKVLAEHVAGGSCVSERRGNEVRYKLEDTTFSEPTRTRMRALRAQL